MYRLTNSLASQAHSVKKAFASFHTHLPYTQALTSFHTYLPYTQALTSFHTHKPQLTALRNSSVAGKKSDAQDSVKQLHRVAKKVFFFVVWSSEHVEDLLSLSDVVLLEYGKLGSSNIIWDCCSEKGPNECNYNPRCLKYPLCYSYVALTCRIRLSTT